MTDPFVYHPYYCEENIWHLCHHPKVETIATSVIYISNAAGRCPFWCQKISPDPMSPVVWDYHVILLGHDKTGLIWDLDSTLRTPTKALHYFEKTWPAPHRYPTSIEPKFRLIPVERYKAHFTSDRTHMVNTNGTYVAPPPPWPLIGTPDSEDSLEKLTDMEDESIGTIVTLSHIKDVI